MIICNIIKFRLKKKEKKTFLKALMINSFKIKRKNPSKCETRDYYKLKK